MASPHHKWSVYSRSKGKSAIAVGAYIERKPVWDRKRAPYRSYSKYTDFVWSKVFAPDYAPAWVLDFRKLWSAVEEREDKSNNRANAQLLRMKILGLPRELTLEQNLDVLSRYIEQEYVSRGWIIHVGIHDSPASDGGRNLHAHLAATMRYITEEGFGLKARAWNGVNFRPVKGRPYALNHGPLLRHRKLWTEYVNEALAAAGSSERIDHRTLKAQGIDRIATPDIGPAIHSAAEWAKAKRDELADVQAYNRARQPGIRQHAAEDLHGPPGSAPVPASAGLQVQRLAGQSRGRHA